MKRTVCRQCGGETYEVPDARGDLQRLDATASTFALDDGLGISGMAAIPCSAFVRHEDTCPAGTRTQAFVDRLLESRWKAMLSKWSKRAVDPLVKKS